MSLIKIWYKIVGAPSVEKAVSNIDKAISKLEKAVNFHAIEAEVKAAAIVAATDAKAFAEKEAARASRVAAKMKELLS